MTMLKALWRDERGQGMTEYAMSIGIVAVFLIAALVVLRGKIADLFNNISFTQ